MKSMAASLVTLSLAAPMVVGCGTVTGGAVGAGAIDDITKT